MPAEPLPRRALAGLALAALPGAARAFPDRSITLLHGFGAGGAADTICRLLAPPLTELLGRPVVVEPRPGAGGNIASLALARATPDGHTMGLLTGSHAAAAAFGRANGFDPIDSFAWVTIALRYGFVFAVRADHPARDLAGLVALARSTPGGLQYGSLGPGSSHQLTGEFFAATAGIAWSQVPYRSDVAGLTAVLSGEVPVMISTSLGALPMLRGGQLRALAVTTAHRTPQLPEVPTAAETYPGFASSTWAGLAAPAGTPAPVLAQWHAAMAEAVARPAVRERLLALVDGEVEMSPLANTRGLVASEIATWRALIAARGLVAE